MSESPDYPLQARGTQAQPMVLIDPATGEAVTPGTGGGTTGGSLETTQQEIKELLEAQPDALPKQPALTSSDLSGFMISISNTTAVAIVTAVTGQKVRVHRPRIYTKGATDIQIYDGDPTSGGTLLETIPFPNANGIALPFQERPYWESSADKTIYIKSSAAVQVYGRIGFRQGA